MKAMVVNEVSRIENSPLRLTGLSDPQPGRGEVRVRVSCCAVCRTDLHVIEGDLGPLPKSPLVPGHQIVGVIDAMCEACGRFAIGQRIGIAWLRSTCGECRFCTSGRENLCERSRYTGFHEDGGYAEFAVVPEDFAYEIPAAFNDEQAAPLLCAGIIGYRALRRSNLPGGGKLGIFGFGSSAHIIMQIALHRGAAVYVISRGEAHQKLAREMGAVWAGSDVAQMPVKLDSAIVFAPSGAVVPQALGCLDSGGTVALAGIHMSPIPSMDYNQLLYGERDLHPVTANTRDDARELLAEAASAAVRPHISLYRLEEANRALQDLKAGRIDGTAVLRIGT